MRLFFSMYEDGAPHNHDYKVIFGEGDWTVALTLAGGTNTGPLPGLHGELLPPNNRQAKFDLMTIARWNGGWMMEEYLWSDAPSMYRQLGVLPNKPAADLPDLELSAINPLSANYSVENSASNKAKMSESDDALNSGQFDAKSLHLSANVSVYGLTDEPLDLDGFLQELKSFKTAFPDLQIQNKPYRQIIGQGDWTATVAMLSGTHQGPLTLSVYLSDQPIAATGKSFDLLHYTIAHWQDGEIIEMRINVDTFGIIASLGIEI
jgi:predicted ester cyclase